MKLPVKDPEEIKVVTFPFKRELPTGSSIALAAVTVTVTTGTDPAAASMLDGAPQIDPVNLYVLQRVKLGVSACEYELRATATDNNGLKHVMVTTLPVATLH